MDQDAVTEIPYASIIAEMMAIGAAVLVIVVPVLSGGFDPAIGVMLVLVLLTPTYLHASVRRNRRRGYQRRAIGYAVTALVVSVVFAMVVFVLLQQNQPGCIQYVEGCGDQARSAAQWATSGCFAASLVLFLLSGIVGLVGVTGRAVSNVWLTLTAVAMSIAIFLWCTSPHGAMQTFAEEPQQGGPTMVADASGRLYVTHTNHVTEVSARGIPLMSTVWKPPVGFDESSLVAVGADHDLVVYSVRYVLSSSCGPFNFCGLVSAQRLTKFSWNGRVLSQRNMSSPLDQCFDPRVGIPANTFALGADQDLYINCGTAVFELSPNLRHVGPLGQRPFERVAGLGIDTKDNLYVLDDEEVGKLENVKDLPLVFKLSPSGRRLAAWDVTWTGGCCFYTTDGIAVAANGEVAVTTRAGAYRAYSSPGHPLGPWHTTVGTRHLGDDDHVTAIDNGGDVYFDLSLPGNRFVKVSPHASATIWTAP